MKQLRAFYFSGTGNTKFVTHYLIGKLSTEFSSKMFDIAEKRDFTREITEADLLLIAFPIYGSSPPLPMRHFVVDYGKLFENKMIAIAETQYFFSGDGAASLGRTLERLRADVAFAEHFNMPNNLADCALFKVRNGNETDRIMLKATRKMDVFAERILSGKRLKRGFGIFAHVIGYYGQRKWWRRNEKAKRSAVKIDNLRCVGCGWCSNHCPVGNLELHKGFARAKDKCVFCYRCVNFCPKKAITICGNEVKVAYKGIWHKL